MDANKKPIKKFTESKSPLPFEKEVYAVVGAAMEVHNHLGAGFLEPVYQEALAWELQSRSIPFVAQPSLTITYKGQLLRKTFIPDFVAYQAVIIEIKSLQQLSVVEEAQLLNYLRVSCHPIGLLINFGTPRLQWNRYILS